MGKPWSRAGAGGPVALAVLAAGLCAGAQDGVERWLAVAALAPAELGADLLIRAAGPGGPVKGNQGRTRLLSVAFELAGRAVEPYPKLGRGQDLGESRAAYVAYSAGAGVSRLAIQCRVVRGFLGVDPGAARLYLEKFR
ncbi:MAG: hypothetical protein IT161_10305, partial [Bryobacterales bacterium]|nr:hypothetical protein [Bryobacterales bacterium]